MSTDLISSSEPSTIGDSQPSFYETPAGKLPRVSTILDATMSVKQKAVLQNWKTKNVEKEAKLLEQGKPIPPDARLRGTTVHEFREWYLAYGIIPYAGNDTDFSLPEGVTEDLVRQYFDPLLPHLEQWDRDAHIWCERPLVGHYRVEAEGLKIDLPDMDQYLYWDERTQEMKACLWSTIHKYAGCPDDLGFFRKKDPEGNEYWELVLADLKTSEKLYYSQYPEKGEVNWFGKNQGYQKYSRTCLQLGAYWIMVNERFGLDPNLMILVATPGRAQRFTLSPVQKARAIRSWVQRVQQYYGQGE